MRAAIEIKRANPAASLEALKPAGLLEPSDIGPTFYRGLAYLSMKSGEKRQRRNLEKSLTERPSMRSRHCVPSANSSWPGPLVLTSDATGARTAYQDFFALWKDADPDIPILKQAKAEYAKLQ